MATITASAAGGKWSEAAAWEGGVEPKEGDDVVLGAASGSITVTAEAKCRSLEATSYKKTLKIETTQKLKVGTTTSNGGLCINLGAGMTLSATGTINLVSTSGTVEKIKSNGKEWGHVVLLEGEGGKWEFADAFTSSNEVAVEKGELKTGSQNTTVKNVLVSGTAKAVLGSSLIVLTRASGSVWKVATTATLEAGTSTIELSSEGEGARNFTGGTKTYNRVVIFAENVLIQESNTFAELAINTALKTNKPTLVEKSTTQTITTSFTTNSTAGEKLSIKSNTAGKAWTLKKTSGTVDVSGVELEDAHAEGGAIWIDRGVGGLSKGTNNTGWRFVDEEVTAQLYRQRPPNLYSPSGLNSTLLDPFPPFFPVVIPSTTHSRELSATQGQAVSLERQITRALTVSQGQAVTKVAAPSRALSTTQGQGVSVARALARLLTVAQGQAATLAKALARTLSASQGQTAARSATPTRNLALEQGQAVTKVVSLTRSLAATQVASSTISKPLTRAVSAEQGQAVARTTSVGRILTSSQGQAVARVVGIARSLTPSQPSGASFGRVLTRTLSLSQGQEVVILRGHAFQITLSVTQAQGVSRTTTVARTLPVVQSGTALFGRAVTRTLSASGTSGALVARSPARGCTAAQGSSATLGRSLTRILYASGVPAASLEHSLARTLRVGQGQAASLTATVIVVLLTPLEAGSSVLALAGDSSVTGTGTTGEVAAQGTSSSVSASRSILSRVESAETNSEVR